MATVLVIDDDVDLLDAVRDLLASEGHTVLTACNPQEALRLVERVRDVACVVLLDVVMPGSPTGPALVRALHAIHPDARVIVTSALVPREGFTDVVATLDKPFDLDRLLELVEEHCAA